MSPIKPKSHSELQREARPRPPDDRVSASARGYGANWRRNRRMYLNRFPMCSHPGCNQGATDVDHIIPKERGGTDAWENLQALCHSHHSQKTAREDGGYGNRSKEST